MSHDWTSENIMINCHYLLLGTLYSILWKKALGFLDDPSQCAPEFCPEVSTAEKRARLIVDWLCKQSFGYQYYDPSDGTLRSYNWKDRGIPQGPDLSAYLANIALFPLDKAVNDHIDNLNRKRLEIDEKQKTCATYARYVDDLILITDSAEILTDLQIIIERELSTVGLELNKRQLLCLPCPKPMFVNG